MSAYYNENDPFAAAWLRKLIEAGQIAPGHVDERSVEDVRPSDLAGFTQCHFFAGVGVWSYALRCAGWPDDRPVWTGSCPCQPFSAAGRRKGTADERHLWPAFFHLFGQCRPDTIFGEQVASKDGLAWLDLISSDLEAAGYAVGAVDTCAAGFGAPHIRQRLYWVAHAQGRRGGAGLCNPRKGEKRRNLIADGGANGGLDNPLCAGLEGHAGHGDSKAGWPKQTGPASEASDPRRVGHTNSRRWERRQAPAPGHNIERTPSQRPESEYGSGLAGAYRFCEHGASPTDGFWRNADWLFCRDGRWRPVEPGTSPLAHGAPARVGRLRGYGNAIVAPQAEAFIRAFIDIEQENSR